MKIVKLFFAASVLLANSAFAEIFEAWDFHAIDGDQQQNIELFESARAIQEKLGVKVEYWQHDVGGENVISYVLRFDDLAAWAAFKDAAMSNGEWTSWIASEWPKLRPHLVASYALNNVFKADAPANLMDGYNVSYLSAWKAGPNASSLDLMASIQKSTAISEKFGLQSNTYISGPEGIYYVAVSGENFTSLEKQISARNASPEWQAYWTAAQTNPAGEFVRQAWITRIQ